ncbi:MAG: TonB-dependent receptor, partial [Methylobacillus sp.]|nr:TonB-dependent receptor [Methylobacillus sp.]
RLPENFNLYLAYTLLDAKFTAPFQSCRLPTAAANICNAGDMQTIQSGSIIPGTYRYNLYGELAWKYAPIGFTTALEVRKNSKTYVNYDSRNGFAEGYTVWSWRGGFKQKVADWNFSEFVRVENLFNQRYVGSVRVADINQQFYEPAPTRNWLLGLNASYKF